MKRFLVLDFVSNNLSMTNAGLARIVANQAGVTAGQTFLVARQDQQAAVRELVGLGGTEFIQTSPDAGRFEAIPVVRRIVDGLRGQLLPGQTILVVSYSGPVMRAVAADGNGQVEAASYRE